MQVGDAGGDSATRTTLEVLGVLAVLAVMWLAVVAGVMLFFALSMR